MEPPQPGRGYSHSQAPSRGRHQLPPQQARSKVGDGYLDKHTNRCWQAPTLLSVGCVAVPHGGMCGKRQVHLHVPVFPLSTCSSFSKCDTGRPELQEPPNQESSKEGGWGVHIHPFPQHPLGFRLFSAAGPALLSIASSMIKNQALPRWRSLILGLIEADTRQPPVSFHGTPLIPPSLCLGTEVAAPGWGQGDRVAGGQSMAASPGRQQNTICSLGGRGWSSQSPHAGDS